MAAVSCHPVSDLLYVRGRVGLDFLGGLVEPGSAVGRGVSSVVPAARLDVFLLCLISAAFALL